MEKIIKTQQEIETSPSRLLSQSSTVIFDMDGTIYELDGDNNGFKNSSLHKAVKNNTVDFISKNEGVSKPSAEVILDELSEKNIYPSIYASEKYDITRKEFFDVVWNIDPSSIVKNYQEAVQVISEISKRNINLILLTQAPKVWQSNVFVFLNIQDLFSEIYTGEDYIHKNEVFPKIAQSRQPHSILAIGDQIETDINPAKDQGFSTFHVNSPRDLLQLINE